MLLTSRPVPIPHLIHWASSLPSSGPFWAALGPPLPTTALPDMHTQEHPRPHRSLQLRGQVRHTAPGADTEAQGHSDTHLPTSGSEQVAEPVLEAEPPTTASPAARTSHQTGCCAGLPTATMSGGTGAWPAPALAPQGLATPTQHRRELTPATQTCIQQYPNALDENLPKAPHTLSTGVDAEAKGLCEEPLSGFGASRAPSG